MAYAALAIGFGIVIGILFIVRGETGSGLGMLGLAVVVAGLSFSSSASAGLLITTIATVVCRVAFACSAVRSEITGKTVQYHGGRGGFGFTRPVTRQDSPETFRSCTNWRGALSIGFIGFSIVSFRFYRRLESEDLLS
jgi:hypothetical protein